MVYLQVKDPRKLQGHVFKEFYFKAGKSTVDPIHVKQRVQDLLNSIRLSHSAVQISASELWLDGLSLVEVDATAVLSMSKFSCIFSLPRLVIGSLISVSVVEDGSGLVADEKGKWAVSGSTVSIVVGGIALRNLMRSSIQRYTAPETPSRMRKRSSMLSLVNLSRFASCSSVRLGGS